ncbi:Amine oxidase [Venustampulla echinocandica]|uniref:Amine oxidase n=1 Tax=Venustampulla echinocandica TaxID=2656787 RepID=A0A370TDH7_9HELO|nr:Amine oxidase [Venustampulla echinocandica]RDL32481.1 Amine oxidase [Venustampulla echinocandica]
MSLKPSSSARSIDPYRMMDGRPTFSHVATSTGPSRIIITAGQVGADENGIVPATPSDQIALAFENLSRCLEAAGAGVADILKLTYYIVNYDPKNRHHAPHLIKFLNGHRPATTLVPVTALANPEYLFEIEATAAVAQAPTQTVDVVVVGAGLSGLQTAYDLQKAGFSCVVVEARDRVGGKTWSVEPIASGKVIDLGAAWVNDTNQTRVHALAKKLGLATVVQNTKGNVIQHDLDDSKSTFVYGTVPLLAEINGTENMVYVRDLVEETCQQLDLYKITPAGKDLDKLTLEEFVKAQEKGESAFATVTIWTRVMLGLEPSEMSALFFLDYCNRGGGFLQMRSDKRHGGQYMRLVQGTQSLSKGLTELLAPGTVILNSPVRLIRQDGSGGAYVSSGRGDFKCRKVVVSVPTPLYKEITFVPALSEAKTTLSSSTVLGYTSKAMLMYDTPWWRTANLCGMVQSFKGPVAATRDTSNDDKKQYSLTCFLVGDWGREQSKKTKAERHQGIISHIRELFSPFVEVPEPITIIEHEWAKDQWAQGCPCPATPPGIMSQYGHAMTTVHGNVHFVGTETAVKWKGYMEGAIESGERGAEEVIKSLTKAKL